MSSAGRVVAGDAAKEIEALAALLAEGSSWPETMRCFLAAGPILLSWPWGITVCGARCWW